MRTFLTDLEQVIKRKLKSAENSHVFLTISKLLVLQLLDITFSYAFDFVIKFYGLLPEEGIYELLPEEEIYELLWNY